MLRPRTWPTDVYAMERFVFYVQYGVLPFTLLVRNQGEKQNMLLMQWLREDHHADSPSDADRCIGPDARLGLDAT